MRKEMKWVLKGVALCLLVIFVVGLFFIGWFLWLYTRADFQEPQLRLRATDYLLSEERDSLRRCGENSLQLNRYGLWEAKVGGTAVERGAALGAMAHDLIYRQEQVFVEQIRDMIPSERYLRFLRACIAVFNRHMARHIPEEYRQEIAAMAHFCTHDYDLFGTPYERQLNYHAAHDIGHTMQEYMLVGCSSFAAWGGETADETLLVGRNFDFYVGDEFARQKLVLFVEPDEGYRFASITWPGMLGVVSGMNEKGLTVTLNAAKGALPTSSALPISLLARHILQYASTIDEAYRIASEHRTFVSESFLIGSAADGAAAVIEKSPERIGLYRGHGQSLAVTNHYQSHTFAADPYNIENIAVSDSRYRHARLTELLTEEAPLTPERGASILRNRYGLGGEDIGLANEMALNQSIAHHAVLFEPMARRMWVSTSPWQAGAMLCYDLDEVFADTLPQRHSWNDEERMIGADTTFLADEYPRIGSYRRRTKQLKEATANRVMLSENFVREYIALNPCFYETYDLVGDYYRAHTRMDEALQMWRTALGKEIPRVAQRLAIEKKLKRYDTK